MKIVTAVVNNPVFIEIQHTLLQFYMPCEYEFIVFNDAKDFPDKTNQGDTNMPKYITKMCEHLAIKCINIPNKHHSYQKDAAIRCADSMNFILNYQRSQPSDEYILLDSDMFPIAPIPIEKYRMANCALVEQERLEQKYFWNGLYYFNTAKMTNMELMNWNCLPGFDVGVMMVKWLKLQEHNNIFNIKHLPSLRWNKNSKNMPDFLNQPKYHALLDFLENDPRNSNDNKYFCEIYDNTYLHYRAGGNWREEGMQFHISMTNKLRDVLLHHI
jgi:hypothetical protein